MKKKVQYSALGLDYNIALGFALCYITISAMHLVLYFTYIVYIALVAMLLTYTSIRAYCTVRYSYYNVWYNSWFHSLGFVSKACQLCYNQFIWSYTVWHLNYANNFISLSCLRGDPVLFNLSSNRCWRRLWQYSRRFEWWRNWHAGHCRKPYSNVSITNKVMLCAFFCRV